jgi:tetratricopeptide (TPR) repeat protein
VLIAHAYVVKKLYDTAETILDMLVKDRKDAAPKNAAVYYVYGLIYDATNEPAKALKAYEKAVELRPKYPAALINLGVHQLRNKQYDAAMQTYELLTGELGNTEASTWSSLGSAYRGKSADYGAGSAEQAKWLLEAETAFKRATTANKNYGPAYYNLGLLYLDAKPFPDGSGGSMDNLVRLKQAKTYFDEYKNMPGVDIKLYDERMKDVNKLIKREEKNRK